MKINRYRLYLQVVSLVDLIDSSGDYICSLGFNRNRNQTRRSSFE